jgi:hypothetical protein
MCEGSMSNMNEAINILSKLSNIEKLSIYQMLKEQLDKESDIDYLNERLEAIQQVNSGEKNLETINEMFKRLEI